MVLNFKAHILIFVETPNNLWLKIFNLDMSIPENLSQNDFFTENKLTEKLSFVSMKFGIVP